MPTRIRPGGLIAVAPAAAGWTPEIVRMFRDERSPYLRSQMRIALNAIGTPEARQAAAGDQMKESFAQAAPVLAFVAVTSVVAILLVRTGWGVLLGFLFPALSFVGFLLDDSFPSPMQPLALVAAPIFSLTGAIAAFRFGVRADSDWRRRLGIGGTVVAIVALLLNLAMVAGLFGFYRIMESG